MCSTCDCDKNPIDQTTTNESKVCRKCGSSPFILLDKVHYECKECFLESCNRKIRSTIGKSKLLRNDDAILLAYSGGQASTCLLDLMKFSMQYEGKRHQNTRPSILYIDESCVLKTPESTSTSASLSETLRYARKLCPDWPIYYSRLENVMSSEPEYQVYSCGDKNVLRPSDPQLCEQFRSKLDDNLLSLTDKQEYVRESIRKLIDRIATHINSTLEAKDELKFVLTGSSATQLSSDLLVSVILGQGSTIKSTVDICDRRAAVAVLRPMRHFSKKEIAFYMRAKGLESHVNSNLSTLAERKASIQTVTEAFLNKLYVDYPSTFSTLLRTGTKLLE